ncbi:MAG: hypothetical protein V5A28_15875 [Haloarculaceae archaeon]
MFQPAAVESVRAFLEGLDSLGAQVGVSVGAVAVIAVVGWVLLPRLVENVRDSAVQWALGGVLLRLLQSGLAIGVVVVMLTWGYGAYVDEAVVQLENQTELVGRLAGSLVFLLLAYVGARVVSENVEDLGRQTEWITPSPSRNCRGAPRPAASRSETSRRRR